MRRVIYNLLFPVVFLGVLPGFLRRMVRRGNYRNQIGQRFGFYSAEVCERLHGGGPRPWLQAVSVGEMFVALKLIGALRERCPDVRLILSATTTTGLQLARERAGAGVEVVYTPIDSWGSVRRAYETLRPTQVIIVDGGLWPNLLWEARCRKIPVALASARLSPRSERRFRQFRWASAAMFELLDLVCVPEPGDVERWTCLGVPPERLKCTGNIKFDEEAPAAMEQSRSSPASYLRDLGVPEGAPILLAASTHPGEEEAVAEIFLKLRQSVPALFLIVAPRHAERAPEVLSELTALGLQVVSRSRTAEAAIPHPDALLLDTTGELRDWPPVASVVFIGKSLLAVGGQNPAEAAAAGKPIVMGPHMENFGPLTNALIAAGAAVQAATPSEITAELLRLLTEPAAAAEMGRRGKTALAGHRGAARRTADLLIAQGGFSACQ